MTSVIVYWLPSEGTEPGTEAWRGKVEDGGLRAGRYHGKKEKFLLSRVHDLAGSITPSS